MIKYKDILKKLEGAGYSTYRLRKEKLLSEYTLTSIRTNKPINISTLDTICRLTGLPVEELIEYRQDEKGTD